MDKEPLSAKAVNAPGLKSKKSRVGKVKTVPYSARANPTLHDDSLGLGSGGWTRPHRGDQGDNWGQ